MPREFGYIAVEGPHDIELIAKLLKPSGFNRVKLLTDLDPYWGDLVPKSYPPDNDLLKRVPVPMFFQTANHSVAIQSAIGVANLVKLVQGTLDLKQGARPGAIGIALDADDARSAQQRFSAVVAELENHGLLTPAQGPANMGNIVTVAGMRWGIYVLPDNASSGTLESILLECAEIVYPDLKRLAADFIAQFDRGQLARADIADFIKPAGPSKAVIACISSVLKPGKAIQVSLQDNRWLEGQGILLPKVTAVIDFLKHLLSLP